MDLKIRDHSAYHADNRADNNTLAMHSSQLSADPDAALLSSNSRRNRRSRPDGKGGGNY